MRVCLETTDRILEEKMLQEYPGVLMEGQCRKEQHGDKTWFIFSDLEIGCIGQWLQRYHQTHPKHSTTRLTQQELQE